MPMRDTSHNGLEVVRGPREVTSFLLRFGLVALLLALLLGCEDTGHHLEGGDLSGVWVRVGYPECEGSLPLQELPVERGFIFSGRLTVEQRVDDLTFTTDGLRIMGGRLDGTDILLDVSYDIAIDAIPPLRYAEVSVHRRGMCSIAAPPWRFGTGTNPTGMI